MLSIAGFSMEVLCHERSSVDYWDGNWLNVHCMCIDQGARVEVSGSIVRIDELSQFLQDLKPLYSNLMGTAILLPLEPNLTLTFTAKSRGHFDFTVNITADHLAQRHSFSFDVDQTHVGATIEWISRLLNDYPIVGRPV
jgi:hypothetical protein